jgi:hypothetical protein
MLETPKASDTIIFNIISENSAILALLFNKQRARIKQWTISRKPK